MNKECCGSPNTCEKPCFHGGKGSVLDVQIGGDHYRSMAIQPVTYIESNGLDFLAGNVVKYVSRHRNKNGVADVRKAIHYCQLILELQYGEKQ